MRSVLQVDGVGQVERDALRELAKAKFGKANASLMIRFLIAEAIEGSKEKPRIVPTGELVRKQIRLPASLMQELESQANSHLSEVGFYIQNLLMRSLDFPALHIDELEILRRSNYELSKIGTNFNQLARAFNTIIKANGGGKPPEVAKKLAAARAEIKSHTSRVQLLLEKQQLIAPKKRGIKSKIEIDRPTKRVRVNK